MYKRKTEDVWALEYDYGYGDGTEVLCWCSTYEEAKHNKKDYIENERIVPTIRKHREKINA